MNSDNQLEIESMMKAANELMDHLQYHEASMILRPLVHGLRKSENKNLFLSVLFNFGVCLIELGQFSDAKTYLQEGLEISKKISDLAGIGAFLHELSIAAHKEGEINEAIALSEETVILKFSIKNEDSRALNQLAILYQETGQLEKAYEVLEISKALSERSFALVDLGAALNELGIVSFALGNYVDGVRHFVESINIKRARNDSRGIELTLRNLRYCLQNNPEAESLTEVRYLLGDRE